MTATTTIPEHAACPPVETQFGTPPDRELLLDPAFADTVNEVTVQAEIMHQRLPEDLETGEAAATAIKTLGCVGCELSGVCPVETSLRKKVEVGAENRALVEKVNMLATAPGWLTAARLNQAGMSPADIPSEPDAVRQALASGSLDLDKLLGTTANRLLAICRTTDELPPELQALSAIPQKQKLERPLEMHRITAAQGDAFDVMDASSALGLPNGVEPLPSGDYAILTDKILQRMQKRDQQGKPQILSPDNTMQKALRNVRAGDVQVFEMRMSSKNRLYFSIETNTGDQPPRIIIFGGHGGDERSQTGYINNVLANRRTK